MNISTTKVVELINALAQQRDAHAKIMADIESAESAAQGAADEVSRITQGIGEREAELARSGKSLPSSLFKEDEQCKLAQRHQRILALRAAAQREPLGPVEMEIARLKREISAAWKAAGEDAYREALSNFRLAALELRTRLLDVLVLRLVFRGLYGIIPDVVVRNPMGGDLINSVDRGWLMQNDPEKTGLRSALREVETKIREALAGKPANGEPKEAGP